MNGTFDDTPAFLACLTIADSHPGAIIYMPAGTVNIASSTSATLQVPTETTIRGAGTDRTIVKWNDASNVSNLFCGPSRGRGRHIVLEDFTVVGGWATNFTAPGSNPQCFPIYIQNVDGLSIRRVCSKYSRMMGIRAACARRYQLTPVASNTRVEMYQHRKQVHLSVFGTTTFSGVETIRLLYILPSTTCRLSEGIFSSRGIGYLMRLE